MSSRAPLLPWIIAFKAMKTTLLLVLGVALLASRRDPIDVWFGLAAAVHLPVTSHVFSRIAALVMDASPRKEVALAMTAFGYALLMGTEGVGLYLKRAWARWFTVGVTSSLVPLEVFEIVRAPHPMRVTVLFLNVLVVVYLLRRKDAFE
jgi:uncharacterized membrane protein (DUF2068 family)